MNPPGKIFLVTAPSREDSIKVQLFFNSAYVHNIGLRDTPVLEKNRKEKLVARNLSELTEVDLRKRKCRLIVRNLSFQSTEQNLVDKMSKFGPLVSVEIPLTEKEKRSGTSEASARPAKNVARPTGFGFVTFLCEKDAKLAVEDSSGLKVCNREVAVDYCMSKESYIKYGKTDDAAAEHVDGIDEVAEESTALSKEDGDDTSEILCGAQDDGTDENESRNAEEDDSSCSHPEQRMRPFGDDIGQGCTVFLRGLPFDASVEDIKASLKEYGRIILALIVKDKQTQASRGSAFVKFADPSMAERCITESCMRGGTISINDRSCRVDLAVDRNQAHQLRPEDRKGKDKRNMYLANEGLVVQSASDADEATKKAILTMSESDKEKRLRSQSDKRKKLQNPLFFVSSNRLSIRNIGKATTDAQLRILCLKAVKAGIARGLVTRADVEAHVLSQGEKAEGFTMMNATNATDAVAKMEKQLAPDKKLVPNCIRSCKIMLDLARLRDGVPQSRGFGFVEFSSHLHALACLRELNNNVKYSELAADAGGRFLVEFSVENIRKVKILEERTVRANNRARNNSGHSSSSNETQPDAVPAALKENSMGARPATKRSSSNLQDHQDSNKKRKGEKKQ